MSGTIDMSALLNLVQNKRAEIKARSGDFLKPIKPPVGKSRWRILPGAKNPEKFFSDFAQHFIKDKDGNVKGVFVCTNKTYGQACQVCDKLGDAIRGTKDDAILKQLKESNSRTSYLVNALRMDGENKNPKKPLILELPTKVLDAYMLLLAERFSDGIKLLDPNEGRDVIITREGSGFNTTYALNDAAVNSAVDPEAMANLIDIEGWIETEKTRGWSKGTAIVDDVFRGIASLPMTTTARIAGPAPSAASLVPSARVIEVEAEALPWEASATPAVAPAQAVPAAAAPVETVAAGAMDDAELEALLKQLD